MRIAIYFNHYQTLGHATRVLALVKALKKKYGAGVRLLILHSGKESVITFHDHARVIDLPYSLGGKWFRFQRGFRFNIQMVKRLGMDTMLKARVSVMKKALADFRPNIFVTEYYPFGFEFWAFELEYVIKYAKERFNTRIVSSVGYPDFEPRTGAIVPYFDRIFFHHRPQEMRHYVSYLRRHGFQKKAGDVMRVLRDCKKKISYTGYLLEKKPLQCPARVRRQFGIGASQPLVVISRGGGVVRDDIITAGIAAARECPQLFFFISAGPATPEKTFKHFQRLSAGQKNMALVYYVRDFEDLMNAADINVAMAGYNTISRLLWLKKQSVIVPLETLSADIEQERRLDFVRKTGLFVIMRDVPLSGECLAAALRRMMEKPLKARVMRGVSFDGARITAEMLACLR